jgi:hypothetical protein
MLEMGYCKLFHGLTLNHDPPSLSLQSSQNFRHEPGFWWAELFLWSPVDPGVFWGLSKVVGGGK